jgi:hypothetical protein
VPDGHATGPGSTPASWHAKVDASTPAALSVALNAKLAVVAVVVAGGFVTIEIVGPVRSTVHERVSDVELPPLVVLIVSVWTPSPIPLRCTGDEHGLNEPPSSLQSLLVPPGVNAKSAVVAAVTAGGPESIVSVGSASLVPVLPATSLTETENDGVPVRVTGLVHGAVTPAIVHVNPPLVGSFAENVNVVVFATESID